MINLIKPVEKARLYLSELFDRTYWYFELLKYPRQPPQPKEKPPTKEEIWAAVVATNEDLEMTRYRLVEEHQETLRKAGENYELRRAAAEEWYEEWMENKYQDALELGYISEGESLRDLAK
jgi:hypothetical protein